MTLNSVFMSMCVGSLSGLMRSELRLLTYLINIMFLVGNMGQVLPEYLSKWSTEKVKKGRCRMSNGLG